MIYLHIPFCRSRCIYCDFYSTTQTEELRGRFVDALCSELVQRREELRSNAVRSVYFGGGTPSLLRTGEVARVLDCIHKHFDVSAEAEITFEANPDDVTEEWVSELRALGINRVSLGVQSFNEGILRLLNRRHSAEQARRAVHALTEGGISNVSIDLIYGLPEQTEAMFREDLEAAFSLPIKHLSSYALSVEAHTPLAVRVERGELAPADEEVCAAEYEALMRAAEEHGFVHYEISNFALPGFHSRHNSGYWDGTPYLGAGPAAHSFDGKDRRYNLPNLQRYVAAAGRPEHEVERLTEAERFDELVFTSLRTQRGLDLAVVESRYGKAWLAELLRAARPYVENGKMEMKNNRLALTKAGILTSDYIMSELMRG